MEITVIPKKEPVKIDIETGKIKKLRVAAYARVSTDLEDQKNSFENQKEEFETRIKQNPEWEFAKMYADRGISGTQIKHRVQFKAMLDAAENGEIDLILTKSISRFARNTVDLLVTVRRLVEIGVGVFFEKENILTTKDNVDLVLTMYASLAESESRSISENVKWGVRKLMAKNERKVPTRDMVGYSRDSKGNWYINEEAFLVQDVFRYFIEGDSYRQIIKKIKKEDPNKDRVWNVTRIHRILRNEKYKGTVTHQKTVVIDVLTHKQVKNDGIENKYIIIDHHDAIINEEIFDYVQMILDGNCTKFGEYSVSSYTEFSNIIICENCGRPLTRIKYLYNNEYVLTCKNTSKNKADYLHCESSVVSYSLLCKAASEILERFKDSKDISIDFTKSLIDEMSIKDFSLELKDIEEKISKVNAKISALVKSQVENDNNDNYELEFNKLKASRSLLNHEYQKLQELARNNHDLQRNIKQINNLLENGTITDLANIKSFIGLILHRNNGDVRFGIKGQNFVSLTKEEIMNQMKNNQPIYSSSIREGKRYIDFDVVILGGIENV